MSRDTIVPNYRFDRVHLNFSSRICIYIYIYHIYVDQSSFDDEKLGSRSNYAHVCQQFRDTPHDQRHASYSLLNKKPGSERFFSPFPPPSLIAFHSTDKGAALNIKVILFLLFALLVALKPRERNFRFGYKLEKRKWR